MCSSQNGTSERAWLTLFDMSRCLLLDPNYPILYGTMVFDMQLLFTTDALPQEPEKRSYEKYHRFKTRF